MIHAYNELYLNEAARCLAHAFDYALNECGFEPDWFGSIFASSPKSSQFAKGNPLYLAGKSGEELVQEILLEVCPNKKFPMPVFREERTKEYWAGWALAHYQWHSSRCFKDILSKAPLSEIISMHLVFHEMDITRFYESMDRRLEERQGKTKLAEIRESRGLSQGKLASLSTVGLRSIQLYEQRINDIDKAQGQTLFKLSLVLGCSIEDLLENPASI